MSVTYVGVLPRNLESGRPIFFGDVLDPAELDDQDHELLAEWLVNDTPAPKAPETPEVT